MSFGKRTHCKWGHPFAGDNLVLWGEKKVCRQCTRARAKRCKMRQGMPKPPPLVYVVPVEPMPLAWHLKNYRVKMGWTRKDLAEAFDLCACTVTRWENGKRGFIKSMHADLIARMGLDPSLVEPWVSPVTAHAELRTHCGNGHEWSSNARYNKGRRFCKTCASIVASKLWRKSLDLNRAKGRENSKRPEVKAYRAAYYAENKEAHSANCKARYHAKYKDDPEYKRKRSERQRKYLPAIKQRWHQRYHSDDAYRSKVYNAKINSTHYMLSNTMLRGIDRKNIPHEMVEAVRAYLQLSRATKTVRI